MDGAHEPATVTGGVARLAEGSKILRQDRQDYPHKTLSNRHCVPNSSELTIWKGGLDSRPPSRNVWSAASSRCFFSNPSRAPSPKSRTLRRRARTTCKKLEPSVSPICQKCIWALTAKIVFFDLKVCLGNRFFWDQKFPNFSIGHNASPKFRTLWRSEPRKSNPASQGKDDVQKS